MEREYNDWLKLRGSTEDENSNRLCYCGHTTRCSCGDPDYRTFIESVQRGDIRIGDPNNGWKESK